MNIKQAKNYIKQTVALYLKKDEFGEYELPVVRQRPVFLLGAPGVGKTAIMEQVSSELGVAYVSYAMTHHTRQSALGLPVIVEKEYNGVTEKVTEYTMSEIIASVYDTMEETGMKEGILFLDEINCVSETLSPSMLQFLQYKEFGNHKIPEGWVVVTAGNPPEFNKSVREFDVVVLDRLKVLEVTPDLEVFKEYAHEKGVHPAILSFLDLHKEYFYMIENTINGRSYVTARGWEDLSEIILKYEAAQYPVDETLIEQYIRNTKVVKEFSAYYDLYQKYKKDYGVKDILSGEYKDSSIEKAKSAPFDERLSLLGMLMDQVSSDMKGCVLSTNYMTGLSSVLKAMSEGEYTVETLSERLRELSEANRRKLMNLTKAGTLSKDDELTIRRTMRFMDEARKSVLDSNEAVPFSIVKNKYNEELGAVKDRCSKVSSELHHAFTFIEKAFEGGNELLIFVTEMTVNKYTSVFLIRFPSEDYVRLNKELMVSDRQSELLSKLEELL